MLNGAVPKAPFDSWLNESLYLTGAHLVPRFLLCDNGVFSTLSYDRNAVLQLRAELLRAQHVLFLPR
ncbi:thioredoxin 2 [Escherichia coli]|uniref:Thioredoxin 2 n=1 Tax=Escherichia coli TaxID=562 RepID=A0A485JBB3_ECOLX|nr:thioredoxin 2 [Escherichia coli]